MHVYFIRTYLIINNYQLIANVVSLVYINTTDTQRKRSIMLSHDDIFRDIFIIHIFMTINTKIC